MEENRPSAKSETFEARLERLRRKGILVRSKGPGMKLALGEPSPGALDRFLSERDE